MSEPDRILQQKFIDACLLNEESVHAIMQRLHITPRALAVWLTRRLFRTRLNRARRFLRTMRELELTLGAASGATQLSEASRAQGGEPSKASLELIRLTRTANAVRRVHLADDKPPRSPYVHPGIDPTTAAQLIDSLDPRPGSADAGNNE
ncbi:MAG: hypothetical protein QM770_03750 [Tepidisphaeraceae bacterium]